MADHPEIHNIISQYVQQILQIKPEDVVGFTMNYFSSFAPDYFDRYKSTTMMDKICRGGQDDDDDSELVEYKWLY